MHQAVTNIAVRLVKDFITKLKSCLITIKLRLPILELRMTLCWWFMCHVLKTIYCFKSINIYPSPFQFYLIVMLTLWPLNNHYFSRNLWCLKTPMRICLTKRLGLPTTPGGLIYHRHSWSDLHWQWEQLPGANSNVLGQLRATKPCVVVRQATRIATWFKWHVPRIIVSEDGTWS
jgi:hypothetical protein